MALALNQTHEVLRALDAAALNVEWHTPTIDLVMMTVTRIAGEEALAFLTAVLIAGLLRAGHVRKALFIGAALLAGNFASALLKWVYDRPRPPTDVDLFPANLAWIDELWIGLAIAAAVGAWFTRWRRVGLMIAGLTALILVVDTLGERIFADAHDSFPSGHAVRAAAVAAALVLVSWNTRWRMSTLVLGATFVVAVALSRVYLGVHHPTDVLAGSAVAAAAVLALSLVPGLDPFRERTDPPPPTTGRVSSPWQSASVRAARQPAVRRRRRGAGGR